MKVLLIGLSNDRVENHVLTALQEHGVELHLVTEPGSPAALLCRERGIPFTEHHFGGRIERAGRRLIEDLLQSFDPDILHATTSRGLSNGLLAIRRLKHPVRVVAYRGTCGHLSWFDPAVWMSYLHPRVNHIVCVSDAVRRYLRGRGVPASKLSVIYKGHDPAWYSDLPVQDRATFGIPPDVPIVGFIGNMRPVKGVDVLIRALHALPPDLPLHLLLVGEVRDKRLKPLAADGRIADRVHFAGFREDAVALAGLFDVSVMPSVSREGLCKVLVECMSRRIPCVASDVGGMPELIEDGVSGLIVPPRDSAALADALARLLQDPALMAALGEAGRRRIEGPFHVRHTVEQTLALYRSLA